MITLRPRQVAAVDAVVQAYRDGHMAPVMCMPTGGGKTATASVLIERAVAKGRRVWFLAHLREILDATADKLDAQGVPYGWVMAGRDADRSRMVHIVSVQTAVRRLDGLDKPDLLIIDEAHLAVSQTYQDIIRWAGAGCRRLLLTATPVRLDGRGMREIADTIVTGGTTAELIAEGLLCDIRYYAPPSPDLSGVARMAGDYNKAALAVAMDTPKITGDAVAHYLRLGMGRRCLVFCVSIAHAKAVAAEFVQAGLRAVAVSGDSDTSERDAALAGLRDGGLDVVCNCALYVAGVDAPAVSCIILLSPTQSLVKYLQSIGRGLRTHPGKDDCLVLDHAGNFARLGSPLEPRLWSLDGPQKKAQKKPANPVKTCPTCYCVVPASVPACGCGHVFAVVAREIERVSGDLSEVDLTAARDSMRRAQGMANTLGELIEFGRKRGYKRPELWARAVYRARMVKKGVRG